MTQRGRSESQLLTRAEIRDEIDRAARERLGMTGEEFFEKWQAGELDEGDAKVDRLASLARLLHGEWHSMGGRGRSASRCTYCVRLVADHCSTIDEAWDCDFRPAEMRQPADVVAERDRYREALEKIAGPADRPFLGPDGKRAARALQREPASPEAIAKRAERDFKHYVHGIPLFAPSKKGPR